MARPPSRHPTEGEWELLQVLWETGPAELAVICGKLRERRDVATTTVATMLNVMLSKKLVRRSKGSRGYRWAAAVTRQHAIGGTLRTLLDRMFDGSAQRLVAHLIQEEQLSAQDREAIRRILAEHRPPPNPPNGA